jgi:phospholipid/cholesterol/gamma-HCH transport system substrate-binding protein
MSPKGREIRVGLVILAAIVVLAAGIFLIGSKNNLFSHKTRYYVEFNSVSGLKPGSPVQLDGVNVGAIERVVLSENPQKKDIRVWIRVEQDYTARLRGPADPKAVIRDQAPSLARIKTLGLLGDKYIDLNSGSPVYPPIAEEGKILAAQPTNVDALLASGEGVMDNVVEITHSLNTILSRMERGEGLLGQLTSDSPQGRRLQTSLTGASESLQRMLDQAQHGPGLLPGLLNDPSSRTEFNETLASLHKVAQDLQGFTADLESSDALLPRLVKDKEYGREVTEQIRQLVQRLNEVSGKLDKGNGTAAQLINDPKIYDAVNDIIVGVNQSKVLRWLIRSRQKKGIDKRYEDTKKAIERSGGTPEPLDKGKDPEEKTPETATPPPPVAAPPPGDSTAPPPPSPTEGRN